MTDTRGDLFISYKRKDAEDASLWLYQHLTNRFGERAVFRDQQKIPSGAKWKADLKAKVLACKGFIVVVGPGWNEPWILQELQRPDDWVRQEIQTALAADKPIFPVILRDAKVPPMERLPEEIRPALENYNHFRFHDGSNWVKDLDRLCSDIADKTGLTTLSQGQSRSTSIQERLLSQLDRNKEAGCVNQNFTAGKRLFLAMGGSKSGFRYFAVRCALEAMRASAVGSSGYQAIALNWGRYADPEEPAIRRSMLLVDIMETLIKQEAVGSDGDLLASIERILRNIEPTVFHSTVRGFGRGTQDIIDEWFGFWAELFSRQTAPIAAMLFVEQSAWGPFSLQPARLDHCQCIVDPRLGKVERRHLDDWLETQLRRVNDDALYREVKATGKALFRFPRSARHFEEISESILAIWANVSG